MIIHRYANDSERYEFELGDRVIIERTIESGLWFNIDGPSDQTSFVTHIFPAKHPEEIVLAVTFSPDWDPVRCSPNMVQPHPHTLAAARYVSEPR